MSMKMLAGAAAVVALIATPAMATQQKAQGPQQQSADATGGKKVKKMQNRLGSRASIDDQRRSGFLPLDVTGGVVGGALNTAGASQPRRSPRSAATATRITAIRTPAAA
jgi:hypothetical protein